MKLLLNCYSTLVLLQLIHFVCIDMNNLLWQLGDTGSNPVVPTVKGMQFNSQNTKQSSTLLLSMQIVTIDVVVMQFCCQVQLSYRFDTLSKKVLY